MMIEGFMELMADYMYDKVTEIVDKPEHYYLVCLQPKNEKYKLVFIKELFLLLSANIIYVMISHLNKRDKIRTIQRCLFVSYVRKVLKSWDNGSKDIGDNETYIYLKRLDEYYQILYHSHEDVTGIEGYPEILLECRKHFMECLNDSCEPYCSTFTDMCSPIIASVLFNSCQYV